MVREERETRPWGRSQLQGGRGPRLWEEGGEKRASQRLRAPTWGQKGLHLPEEGKGTVETTAQGGGSEAMTTNAFPNSGLVAYANNPRIHEPEAGRLLRV